jgi:DNA repair protein RadC
LKTRALLDRHLLGRRTGSPSRQDVEVTSRLCEDADLCRIPFVDHVVLPEGGYVSPAERDWR